MQISKLCRSTGHKWLESIDMDAGGNLYFSDNAKNALYRIRRTKDDNTLPFEQEEKLLWGFKHTGGISIDRKNNDLYLGVRLLKDGRVKGKILQIPLALFDEPYQGSDYSTTGFKRVLESRSLTVLEHSLKPADTGLPLPRPNGVIFDPRTRRAFYTHEDLLGLGKRGYLGNTSNSEAKRLVSANGIDEDPTTDDLILVLSLSTINKITRVNLSTGQEITRELVHEKKHIFGLGPDGVLCLENGDVLFASFLLGRVYHLRWNGQGYDDPRMIAEGLARPTDLVIGPSSNGKGESLFVTSTKLLMLLFGGGGNVYEIPNIRELITLDQHAKQI